MKEKVLKMNLPKFHLENKCENVVTYTLVVLTKDFPLKHPDLNYPNMVIKRQSLILSKCVKHI